MKSDLIEKEEKAVSDMAKFLSLLYESTVFQGPIPLSEAITLTVEKMNLSRFEVLALYYRAKIETLIQVQTERLRDFSSFTTHISLTGKGVQALMGVNRK
jgi:hypothetical protein